MAKSRFGPFALEGPIGSEEGSSVYRAIHLGQKRMVAVKMFSAPLAGNNPAAKQALAAEISKLKELKHWNIVRCFGGILEQMEGCLASEIVEGESLAELLERRGRLAWESVVDYSYQIASGLECAHEQGVVHQDMQPDKIIIAEDGTVKIADFRVNRAQNPWCGSSARTTVERAVYRSPEQLAGDLELTHKSDLYALGCMMFEMLIGQPPFTGDTVEAIAEKQQELAPRVDSIVFDVPLWLSSLIGELLDPDPAKRPYGAAAVLLALNETTKQVAAKTGVVEHAAGGFSPLSPQVERDEARTLLAAAQRGRERPDKEAVEGPPFYERAWFLALSLLLLIGGLGTWLAWPENEDRLFNKAVAILEAKEDLGREDARQHLERLLEKFPQGAHVEAAEEYLRELDVASAERKFSISVNLGREPKSEAERLYKEAWDFEQFGDRVTALEKYRGMADLLADEENPDRTQIAFVGLARRQISAIEEKGSDDDRLRFVEARLDHAGKLSASGKEIEAKKLWRGIIELYGDKAEFQTLVDRAEQCLHPRRGEKEAASSSGERPGTN